MNYLPCLSVKQPWAELIASGLKTLELRTWLTNYRGPLVIVASLKRADQHPGVDGPRGQAVALVELLDIRPATAADASDACVVPGRRDYAWRLRLIRRLHGPTVKGQLHIYPAPPVLLRALQGYIAA